MAVYRVPVNVSWTGAGSPGVNVWHCQTAVADNQPLGLQSLVNNLRTFYDSLANVTGGQLFATGTAFSLGTVVDVATDEVRTPTFTTITQGGSGADMPPANQVCISWRTPIAARRGRGRTFLGPLTTGVADTNGSIATAARTKLTNAANALVAGNSGQPDGSWGVYGLVTAGGGSDPAAPRTLRPHVGFSIGTEFAVLRSRRD